MLKISSPYKAKARAKEELLVEPSEPQPPAWLSKAAKDEWARIIPLLMALRTITVQDRALLTIHCQAWGEYEEAARLLASPRGKKMVWANNAVDHPRTIMKNACERVMQTADRFGLSSAARVRLGAVAKVNNGKGNQGTEPAGKQRFFPEGPALHTNTG